MERVRYKRALLEGNEDWQKNNSRAKRSLFSNQKFYDPCLLNNDTLAKVRGF